MSLLRSGTEKVCVASDVQAVLRKLILPTAEEMEQAGLSEPAPSATKRVSISFEATSLRSIDQTVSRVTCHTVARVSDRREAAGSFPVTYEISPSAEHPETFVVGGVEEDVRVYARKLAVAASQAVLAEEEAQRQRDDEAQAHAELLAIVTPQWLIGSWIDAFAEASACVDGGALTFQTNRFMEGRMITARWRLDGDRLHIVGSNPDGTFDRTLIITDADAVSFKYRGDATGDLRRCTRDEGNAPLDGRSPG